MITGKLASSEDFEAYYRLRCDEDNIKWTGHSAAPDRVKIHNWFIDNINKKDRYFFLFFEDNSPDNVAVGYLYMDVVGEKKDTIDTGHGVHSNCGGRGYGTQIIQFALNYAKENLIFIHKFQGWIASDNIGSIKNVLKNGYYKTEDAKTVDFPSGEIKIFEKYMINIR